MQVTTPCVLHPSSSGIQACYNDPVMLCDRPGRARLFVSIQINHSLFWTDNVIDTQKGHWVYSSQARRGEQGGQRSEGAPSTDWAPSQIDTVDLRGKGNRLAVVFFFFLILPWLGRIQKVLSLFVVLIDIPVGKISPRMPYSLFSNDTCKYGPRLTLP